MQLDQMCLLLLLLARSERFPCRRNLNESGAGRFGNRRSAPGSAGERPCSFSREEVRFNGCVGRPGQRACVGCLEVSLLSAVPFAASTLSHPRTIRRTFASVSSVTMLISNVRAFALLELLSSLASTTMQAQSSGNPDDAFWRGDYGTPGMGSGGSLGYVADDPFCLVGSVPAIEPTGGYSRALFAGRDGSASHPIRQGIDGAGPRVDARRYSRRGLRPTSSGELSVPLPAHRREMCVDQTARASEVAHAETTLTSF